MWHVLVRRAGVWPFLSKSALKFSPRSNNTVETSEVLTVRSIALSPFYLLVIYRPLGPHTGSLHEFPEFVADLVTHADNILIIGDFNGHMNSWSEPLTAAFETIIDTLGFTLIIDEASNKNGYTRDMVQTRG